MALVGVNLWWSEGLPVVERPQCWTWSAPSTPHRPVSFSLWATELTSTPLTISSPSSDFSTLASSSRHLICLPPCRRLRMSSSPWSCSLSMTRKNATREQSLFSSVLVLAIVSITCLPSFPVESSKESPLRALWLTSPTFCFLMSQLVILTPAQLVSVMCTLWSWQ